jgi:putative DNA methylase
MTLKAFEWKDKPALIEHLFPVQKISAESFKEQMAGSGKSLTALGSYWKGRKPLILNKACILGSLLPATDNHLKDLEVFELLMGMDSDSVKERIKDKLPVSKHSMIKDFLTLPYNEQVKNAKRPEEIGDNLFLHAWDPVNNYLGTSANSFAELIEQIGIARFGRRPKFADVFCGSGQIPFEAARLGCDVYASDLNPVACLLTWGGFNIVGACKEKRTQIQKIQKNLIKQVQEEIDVLNVETDGKGWISKVYFYCNEVRCPETNWMIPLLPDRIISKGYRVIAELIPNPPEKKYDIKIRYVDSAEELDALQSGTINKGEVIHSPDPNTTIRFKISTIRGDYKEGKENKNRLRMWEKSDFLPRPDDIFQERLYCIQWMKLKSNSSQYEYEFRSVTDEDLECEQKVIDYVGEHLQEWQEKGYIPEMVIETGDKTDEPIRTRGWTHWHHLFNPRHLLYLGVLKKNIESSFLYPLLPSVLDFSSKLSRWTTSGARISKDGSGKQIGGASNNTSNVFYNQALNTLYNWGCRSSLDLFAVLDKPIRSISFTSNVKVNNIASSEVEVENDIYITDPPYGDAVKYEEITEFFIAWLRKNPPAEFANWTWDSRRSLAIKGEDEGFRQGMIAAYRRMAELMPDNGIQILMFTHQSGAIWGDMTNIIWASGLQVTAAWYIVTETDSALRKGSNVKGTIILVLRKRHSEKASFRDDIAWEIESAVKDQVDSLIGLDKQVRNHNPEGLYTDSDLQMAGYAAALKVLTSYSHIDGKDMTREAEAPRQKGKKTFVDELIDFAVQTAVQFLVPVGFEKADWQKLQPVERFYLKMAEIEQQGSNTLDNYQNFAKAFKVKDFDKLMSDNSKANSARLKLSTEFKSTMMAGDSELADTLLRSLLYAIFELSKEIEIDDVLLHLMDNCSNYLQSKALLTKMAEYLADKREGLTNSKNYTVKEEASYARILAEAMKNQRL